LPKILLMKKTYAPIARLALCAIFISPLGFMSSLAQAQTETPIEADTIVITASRGAPQKAKNTLATIDVILADVIQAGQLQVNVSDTLSRVPGIVAQNRQNYAQDIQISSRGFGARSNTRMCIWKRTQT